MTSERVRELMHAFAYFFSDWDVPKLGRDIVLSIGTALLIAFGASRWDRIRWYLTRERADFRRMFGQGATRTREIVVVLDTFRDPRWLPPALQEQLKVFPLPAGPPRFHKIFPDGHITQFPLGDQPILAYASARAATYITDSVAGIPSISGRALSDEEVVAWWDASFVCVGNSYNNFKSDDIKHSPGNLWLEDDGGLPRIALKDGREVAVTQRQQLGYVLKIANPFVPDFACIVCGGIGQNGASGAARFFADNWRRLSRRFEARGFLIVLAVTPGSDQATQEILTFGRESIWRRFRTWVTTSLAPPPPSP